jgi:hypothetical protein
MNENAAGECIHCDTTTSSWNVRNNECQCHDNHVRDTQGNCVVAIACEAPKYYDEALSKCVCVAAMNTNADGECIHCDTSTSSWNDNEKMCECNDHHVRDTQGNCV